MYIEWVSCAMYGILIYCHTIIWNKIYYVSKIAIGLLQTRLFSIKHGVHCITDCHARHSGPEIAVAEKNGALSSNIIFF